MGWYLIVWCLSKSILFCLILLCVAGSEGHSVEEAKFINLSLTSLGKCINALAENSPHIPVRDSKLTRLLRDSFGGYPHNSYIQLHCFASLHMFPNPLVLSEFGKLSGTLSGRLDNFLHFLHLLFSFKPAWKVMDANRILWCIFGKKGMAIKL